MGLGGKLKKKKKLAKGGTLEDDPETPVKSKEKLQTGVKITPLTAQDKINAGLETGKYVDSTPLLESIINTGLGFSPLGNIIAVGSKSMDGKFDPSDLMNFIPQQKYFEFGKNVTKVAKTAAATKRQARSAENFGNIIKTAPIAGDVQNATDIKSEWDKLQEAKTNNEKYKNIDSGLEKMNYRTDGTLVIQGNKNLGNGGTLEGPTHEAGGIDVNQNGIPTTEQNAVSEVEGGEYKYRDPKTGETYVFSNRLPYKIKNK
jgi:hypothetical protein